MRPIYAVGPWTAPVNPQEGATAGSRVAQEDRPGAALRWCTRSTAARGGQEGVGGEEDRWQGIGRRTVNRRGVDRARSRPVQKRKLSSTSLTIVTCKRSWRRRVAYCVDAHAAAARSKRARVVGVSVTAATFRRPAPNQTMPCPTVHRMGKLKGDVKTDGVSRERSANWTDVETKFMLEWYIEAQKDKHPPFSWKQQDHQQCANALNARFGNGVTRNKVHRHFKAWKEK